MKSKATLTPTDIVFPRYVSKQVPDVRRTFQNFSRGLQIKISPRVRAR